MPTVPPFGDLIAGTTRSAVHLEMRDTYTPDDPVFRRWLAGETLDFTRDIGPEFAAVVRDAVARGVRIRRARVVSEPLTDYLRFEHAVTSAHNVAAGEEVRWLPRRQASDLALPGNDCWVFDDRLVRFGHFAGDGTFLENELADDPSVVKLCASAFEAVWERATPHEDYRPT
ncbi:MAG: hypothetical protein GEV10_31870 [Streptosporangiales bacterium]|nr:hypothetical protein [Streptosporangiales bacterium]